MTLVERDLEQVRGLIGELSLDEVEQIYLPLSRLVNLYVSASQELHLVTNRFLGRRDQRVPFVIGIAGSVAVGKSTSVDLITTDGFLYPNAVLEARGLMEKKGFPESFDIGRLLNFMNDVKAGKENVAAPVYSHFHYDIVTGQEIIVSQPDILIVEGLNLLQPARLPKGGEAVPFVSDFLDFSIYIDAEEAVIQSWYVSRFMKLRQTAFRDPAAYFHRYAALDHAQAEARALEIWRTINLKNLHDNILPTRRRAGLIIRKNEDHKTDTVLLRRI
jgi:type I pantothenate kinase